LGRCRPQSTSLQGRWRFQDYPRHFITEPVRTAAVGQRYTYVPRVWDPELCEPEVIISAPHLPSWLALVNNMLVGVPPDNAVDVDIRLVATILPSGRARKYRGTLFAGRCGLPALIANSTRPLSGPSAPFSASQTQDASASKTSRSTSSARRRGSWAWTRRPTSRATSTLRASSRGSPATPAWALPRALPRHEVSCALAALSARSM